ncbi:hypothetical protein PHYSODRAFT_301828 [Phytophthora sojae]|uniref:Uncharacterized protein n=1 Tax=Phytophthora sojae (strain P6497) TaxID=1094619 RepID=G4ZK87_PHYSP|nr:hypothetical protein PHYSODRAFT_301828 [Phytophthora sojae]EGZ15204.1 hypothetical protein PHYSODRAFT_301828 [Phytophthora sojae]|eukprot:XP_009528953.1 hypothetical protein PHYSODRAFT_301828 [Phytophthora sojae]
MKRCALFGTNALVGFCWLQSRRDPPGRVNPNETGQPGASGLGATGHDNALEQLELSSTVATTTHPPAKARRPSRNFWALDSLTATASGGGFPRAPPSPSRRAESGAAAQGEWPTSRAQRPERLAAQRDGISS